MLYKLKKFVKYIIDPDSRFAIDIERGRYDKMSDEEFLKKAFKVHMGYELDLENPRTFNEKLQWLKLYDRNDLYTKVVDKYLVKNWISDIIGTECIIPTLGVWDRFEDIDFDKLPDKFVLKTTHDSGTVIICKDKSSFRIGEAKKRIEKSLANNFFLGGREWPYKNVMPRVISEQYIEDKFRTGQINDYKVFVFEGTACLIQVDFDRFTDHHRNFYDLNWNYVPFTIGYPTNPARIIDRPECLGKLIDKAEKISMALNNPHFIRTDFYIIEKQIYFGEVTFYHGSGFKTFNPPEWDRILGDKIVLPIKN